jgi:uncharacterized protein DUF2804
MPMLSRGALRKRWRYVAAYGEELMLGAARIEVGPFRQSFWAVWDRHQGRRYAHTRMLPGGHEVKFDGPRVRIEGDSVRADLRVGDCERIESICASGKRGWGWTRKGAGMEITGMVELDGAARSIDARGCEDVSAGYHQRHTSWHWSAGVGRAVDGRDVAWNLVSGINDPQRSSERAIWVNGAPSEPDPVEFDGLEAVRFADGSRLAFAPESERSRNDNLVLFRSQYRHVFGTFSGTLAGLELDSGLGVMEQHDAVW